MPRTDVDYFDPNVEALDDSKIDTQVDNLHKEYTKLKTAYREAFRQSALFNGAGDQSRFTSTNTSL